MRRRIASVWDWRDGVYRYFAVPTALGRGDEPQPPQAPPSIRTDLGDAPERLMRALPPGSLYVGFGERAKGEIMASRPS